MEKRPVFFFGAAIFAGVFSAGIRPWRITYAILVAIPILCVAYFVIYIWYERRFSLGITVIAAITALLPITAYRDCVNVWKARLIMFDEYDGKTVEATLRLKSSVEQSENGIRVAAEPLIIDGAPVVKKGIRATDKIILSISGDYGEDLTGGLNYGAVIHISGRFAKPAPQQNNYLFDYQRYLFSKGIAATIYINNRDTHIISAPKRFLGLPVNPIGAGIALSGRIEQVFAKAFPPKAAAIITAMLVGKTESLDGETRGDFMTSGLLHIMAVSGLHIMIIAGLVTAAAGKIGFGMRSSKIVALVFICIFTFAAGFTPSVTRAALAFGLGAVSKIIGKAFDQLTALGCAVIILLAYNPMQAFNTGFILSFASALSICLLSHRLRSFRPMVKLPRMLSDTIRVSVSIGIGCYPVQTALFHNISTVSVISNILCAPLITATIGAGIITGVTGLISAAWAFIPANIAVNFIWAIERIAASTARIPNALVRTGALSPAAILFYYSFISLLFLLIYRYTGAVTREYRLIPAAIVLLAGVSLTLAIYALLNPAVGSDKMEIVFLDVGNSNAAYINIGGRYHIIVDAGGTAVYQDRKPDSETRLYEYLSGRGVNAIDLAIATHGDYDHIQGFESIYNDIPVYNTMLPYIYDDQLNGLAELAVANGSKVNWCAAGDIARLGSFATVETLSPSAPDDVAKTPAHTMPTNDTGLVVRIVFGEMKVLFCGDISVAVETGLVYNIGDGGLTSQLMSVPHHGSKYSSSEAFIMCVSPKTAIAGVGKNNYGHPAPETVDRYESFGADFLRTDRDGMISVMCGREGIIRINRFNGAENRLAWQ